MTPGILTFLLMTVFATFLPRVVSGEEKEMIPVAAAAKKPEQNAPKSTPQDVFDAMRGSFEARKAKGVHARYQFNFSGPNGGTWWIVVNDGSYTMGKGTIGHPDVTFASSDEDWVKLSNGTLGGTWAYMTGRLKVIGSQSLARKLDEVFP